MEIKNKIILVTGAASGLGAATAKHLANCGAVVIAADKQLSLVKQVADAICGVAYDCDVTSESSVKLMISEIIAKQKVIHAVVNCAGIFHAARLIGKKGVMPLNDFEQVIRVNLTGTFNVMRLAAEKMSVQEPVNELGERGVIINTTSIAAFEGQSGQMAYSASKGGVASMTLPAARELSQFGIRVMAIAPGIMKTPMMTQLSKSVQHSLSEQIPFPKTLGDPDYFAQLVAHIIENHYLNGECIRLDGALRLSYF